MRQPIVGEHRKDADGNPAGGLTSGRGLLIRWQNGPLGRGDDRAEPNGAFVEGVIAAAIDRLEYYQNDGVPGMIGRFACRENALAITHLEEALHWLEHRTRDREDRAVEGTHEQ